MAGAPPILGAKVPIRGQRPTTAYEPKGLTGSSGPRFPGGLNQHFAAPSRPAPLTGSYRPPAPIQGSYRPPPPARQEQRAAPLTGAVHAGLKPPPIRGAVNALGERNPYPAQLKQILGQIGHEERGVGQFIKGGAAGVERAERASDREALRAQRIASASKQGGGPLGIPGFIGGLGAKIGATEIAGAKQLLGPQLGKVAGGLTAEAINIPTQALPAAYQATKAAGMAIHGEPAKFEAIGKEFIKGSAVAQLAKGNFAGAAKLAGEHPLGTALEATATGGAVDHIAGLLKRAGAADDATAARLADKGEITREPRKLSAEYAPGVNVPQLPYSKGLVKAKVQKAVDARPVSKSKAEHTLKTNVDHFEAEHLAASRGTREMITHFHHQQAYRLAGKEGLTSFGYGILANPSKLDAQGNPLYRTHLAEAIEHFSKTPEHETPAQQPIRLALRDHLIDLQNSRKFERNAGSVYKVNNKIAAEKRALQPEMQQHGLLTNQVARISKLIPAFQFHFRGENPFVEPDVAKGESPFRLNGKEVSVDEVAKKLADKGVEEKQLSFMTTRPHQSETQPYASGRGKGGQKSSSGDLTGYNFIRGQWDPMHEALERQHLTDAQRVMKARADEEAAKRYFSTREQAEKLIEQKMKGKPEGQQQALREHIATLREKPDLYFHGQKPWDEALTTANELKALGIDMVPARLGHPFATKEYRAALGKRLDIAAQNDRLDSENFNRGWDTRFPEEDAAKNDRSAGPVGLVHSTVATKLKSYEDNLGKAHLGQLPSNFWRRMNVAYSLRHIPGVTQEMAVRLLANEIGPLSYIRGRKIDQLLEEFAKNHPDPQVKLGYQRIKAWTGGTVASQAGLQTRHIPFRQLKGTPLEKPANWWLKGENQKITGVPLKAVRGAVTSFSHATNHILGIERKYIEHPPQLAGMGKHFAQEYKTLTGKRLSVIKAFKGVEKEFLQGRLNPKAIDHFLNAHRDYWGDWMKSSPGFRKVQAWVPFARWYLNSLRFIYQTMPLHHPMKTGVLAAIETGTKELRESEGQGYKAKGFPSLALPYGNLLPFQQGSIPGPVEGERIGSEYYEPAGAVSAGPEGIINAVLPYVFGAYSTAKGINPITGKRLEEEQEGSKKPITDQGILAQKAAEALLEEFIPPVRYVKTATEAVAPEKELYWGKGLPAGLYKAIRPLREEKAYYEGGKTARPRGSQGIKLPEVKLPEIKVPEVKLPEIKVNG